MNIHLFLFQFNSIVNFLTHTAIFLFLREITMNFSFIGTVIKRKYVPPHTHTYTRARIRTNNSALQLDEVSLLTLH